MQQIYTIKVLISKSLLCPSSIRAIKHRLLYSRICFAEYLFASKILSSPFCISCYSMFFINKIFRNQVGFFNSFSVNLFEVSIQVFVHNLKCIVSVRNHYYKNNYRRKNVHTKFPN